MAELKECPFCGSENVAISPYDGAKTVVCMDCLCTTAAYRGGNAESNAIAAWNRRAAPENKALTLDELREMDGEPVWVSVEDGAYGEWTIVAIGTNTRLLKAVGLNEAYDECNYGKTWLAYRRKPKEENDA